MEKKGTRMTKSHLISGLLLAAAWMAPNLTANAAIPATSTDVFSMEYSADATMEPKAFKVFERQLKRAAKKYCDVGTAPGLRQASRRCERMIIARVKTELATRPRRTRFG